MAYGLTATGFVAKTYEVIKAEIEAELRDEFGSSIPLGENEILGQIVRVFAEREAALWELAEDAAGSQDPDAATGAQLDALCALTGTTRDAATKSTVTAWLTGTPTTNVPAASVASVEGTGVQFETTGANVIAAATAWAPTTAYVIGDVVTNASRCYYCTVAGTSAGSGGPTTTADAITDNTVTWKYMGEGTGYVDAAMESVDTGPQVALAGDLNEIETPVAGWESVKNHLDAVLGDDLETDAELRERREDELAAAGTSPIDAVRAALLDVEDVTAVSLFVNNSDVTDGDGVPPHAVEALVTGGADQDVWDALLANVAAGIATHGTEAGTAEDSEGNDIAVEFSRPSAITIWVDVTLTYDADTYPADGDAQVEAAILAAGANYSTGQDVYDSRLMAAVFSVQGVLDVSALTVGTSDPPGAATVSITSRQLATFDSARTDISSSSGTF